MPRAALQCGGAAHTGWCGAWTSSPPRLNTLAKELGMGGVVLTPAVGPPCQPHHTHPHPPTHPSPCGCGTPPAWAVRLALTAVRHVIGVPPPGARPRHHHLRHRARAVFEWQPPPPSARATWCAVTPPQLRPFSLSLYRASPCARAHPARVQACLSRARASLFAHYITFAFPHHTDM